MELRPVWQAYRPQLETLERRDLLAADSACVLQVDDIPAGDAARAARAVNCLAMDFHRHFNAEDGNLLFSPFSIATALAMAYAGADGETETQMQETLHFGAEPGIHESFEALLGQLSRSHSGFELQSANALWPAINSPPKAAYAHQIQSQYSAHTEGLDYVGDVELARQTINDWVESNTRGKIQELIKQLHPNTVMVLTNAVFYRALWSRPFAPTSTFDSTFTLDGGVTKSVPMMYQPAFATVTGEFGNEIPSLGYGYSEHGGFRVLEMPYEQAGSSMVIMLPNDGVSTDDLDAETMASVHRWLGTNPERRDDMELFIPKFKTTVSSKLQDLLPLMGMPDAFNGKADFSKAISQGIPIDEVGHKAFIEVNEQGTEAAAATFVSFVLCFERDTPVLTPDGEKPIQEIRAGDTVLSRDQHDPHGVIEPMVVEDTFQNRGQLLELEIAGKVLRATPEHPFYVRNVGWTKAGDLRAGDMLASDLNSWREVQSIRALDGEHPVYNFSVAKHHTYFVGGQKFGFAVWTHNACGSPDPQFIVDRPFHFFIRDNASSAVLFMGRISDPTIEDENEIVPMFQESADLQPVPGDANGDRNVDFDDFLILAQNFGRQVDAAFSQGDFNSDGAVSFVDFLIMSSNFGRQTPGDVFG